MKGKNFFQYIFILWPYMSLPPHEATWFCEICCKSLEPTAHLPLSSNTYAKGQCHEIFWTASYAWIDLAQRLVIWACLDNFSMLPIGRKSLRNFQLKILVLLDVTFANQKQAGKTNKTKTSWRCKTEASHDTVLNILIL